MGEEIMNNSDEGSTLFLKARALVKGGILLFTLYDDFPIMKETRAEMDQFYGAAGLRESVVRDIKLNWLDTLRVYYNN